MKDSTTLTQGQINAMVCQNQDLISKTRRQKMLLNRWMEWAVSHGLAEHAGGIYSDTREEFKTANIFDMNEAIKEVSKKAVEK